MKYYLLSDNVDTQIGMRLAGVEGVVVHEKEELKDFSVITFKHKVGDKDMGTIGIIGPKRMDYSKVISVMKYINKKLKDKGI